MKFLSLVQQMKPMFQKQIDECPQATPSMDALSHLKSQLIDGKLFFLTLGMQGSLDFMENCAMYGLIDKRSVPDKPADWALLIQGLVSDINTVEETGSMDSITTNVNIEVEVENEEIGYFRKPLFQFMGMNVTPLRIVGTAFIYALYKGKNYEYGNAPRS